MDFDIHQLDDMEFDSEETEETAEAFRQRLAELFAQSPEGQDRLKDDPDMGFWATQLMYYGYQYEGKTLPEMTVSDVRTVVGDLFPRKISLRSPEAADDAIPELIAFWTFLKREHHLPQADAVLEFLREEEPEFSHTMNDPANFGMAKSFFTLGQSAGFNMMSEEGLKTFMHAFNSGLSAPQLPPRPFFLPPMPTDSDFGLDRRMDAAAWKAEKKKRKMREKAKKRNRKQRK